MKCHQCENQAMFTCNQFPLCLHCSTKLRQVENERLKIYKQIMDSCDEQISLQLGSNYQPTTIKAAETGDITLNHINISHSNIGMVNTGRIQAESIDLSIDILINNEQTEMANALKSLVDAILQAQQMSDASKAEIIELLSFIAEESTKSFQYRKKTLVMNTIKKIGELMSLVESVRKIWEHYDIIKNFFV